MQSYFVYPPFYYKQFNTPNEYQPPNLLNIEKKAPEFFSFGE